MDENNKSFYPLDMFEFICSSSRMNKLLTIEFDTRLKYFAFNKI
jgi:hypothetical protein